METEADPIRIKRAILIYEAKRWVGIREVGSDNHGQMVEIFQKAVNAHPAGEAWCVDLVQYCVQNTDKLYRAIFGCTHADSKLAKTEGVLALYTSSPQELWAPETLVEPGDVICWQHYRDDGSATGLGHAGIVVERDGMNVITVEGNTSSGEGINREGDGVYLRHRVLVGDTGKFRILGFLKPWV